MKRICALLLCILCLYGIYLSDRYSLMHWRGIAAVFGLWAGLAYGVFVVIGNRWKL